MAPTLGELAQRLKPGLPELELVGDPDVRIHGVCTLSPGEPGCLAFLANPKYRPQLAATRAAAVVLGRKDAAGFSGNALVARDPYLAFARLAGAFDRSAEFVPGVHPAAIVAPNVVVPPGCHVGPHAVIEPGASIGSGVYVGAGAVISSGARIGDGSRIEPRAVIGSRGFGLARGPSGWEEVPQLGSVVIGDDVEVGANTTIDRGAIGDTVIGDGVKLDNQVQIAHNVRIGAHTAIAACVGIAGSAQIGARCLIGGGAGVAGHIEIGDDVAILGWTMVTRSLPGPGQYGSGIPARPLRQYRRMVAHLRRLDALDDRLAELEKRAGIASRPRAHGEDEGGEPDL
jgi:UDP-3-O-[3-hydroxymyristoyl] glucosamine N-acyltransferase